MINTLTSALFCVFDALVSGNPQKASKGGFACDEDDDTNTGEASQATVSGCALQARSLANERYAIPEVLLIVMQMFTDVVKLIGNQWGANARAIEKHRPDGVVDGVNAYVLQLSNCHKLSNALT